MPNYKKNISSFVLGEKLFLLLNKQLRVTRLLFMHDKTSIVISFSKDNVYLSKEIDSLTFKDSLLDDFQGLEYIMKSSPITYFQNNNVYMDNSKVNSELLYKIINSDGNHTFISVGIPKKIEVLKLYLPFIQDALEAYVDCRDAQYTHSAYEKTLMSEKILKSRTQLTGKLTTGYFYQLSSKMTVLLGKTEQIKEMISKIKNDSEMKTLIKHVEAIEKNADYIGSSVTALQALIPNENLNYDRKVNASELMSKIPGYLGGYLQQISIRRNLSIRIDNVTLGKSEFLISRAEIDDILIPILLSLLDNADKDGTLAISAYSEVNTEYIKITFHNDLIANKEIINIILKPFQKYKISADESGNLTFGNHFISYFTSKDEMVSIRIHLKDFKTFDGTHIQNIKEVTTSV